MMEWRYKAIEQWSDGMVEWQSDKVVV